MAEDTFQLVQEIKGLMTENLHSDTSPTSGTGSSFTALLGLPANQAMELLHEQEPSKFPAIHAAEIWNDRGNDQKTLNYLFNCSPSFPSNSALVERAARFSIFAENSPEASSIPSNSTENSLKLKTELTDSDSNLSSSPIFSNPNQRSTKRKEREKKNNGSARKSKKVENRSLKTGEVNKDEEKLSYVHVRARRGQATDSHSLAERARREKINARMKLLQELVPGCSKISGTASVLDEIINHVQALQRQVEFLSMRLATVNPRIDFNLDSLLAAESGCLLAGNNSRTLTVEPRMWPEIQVNGARQQQHQNQHPQVDVLRPPAWERDNSHSFITQENSLFSYDSPLNSVSLRLNQLNMGL